MSSKKFNVTVTKSDSEWLAAGGILAGAKYGIYKGNQLIDTYTTDAKRSVYHQVLYLRR